MADEEQVAEATEEEAPPPEDSTVSEAVSKRRTQPKEKKSGCMGLIICLVLVAGGGLAALHFTGKLQPLLDSIRKGPEKQEPAPTEPKPDKPDKVEPKTPTPKTPMAEVKPAPEPEPEVQEMKIESPLAAAYRKKYKDPKPGSKIALVMKSGARLAGVLEGFDAKQIHIQQDKASMSVDRSQLSVMSKARFDENTFVAYCVIMKGKSDEAARVRKESLARIKARYASQGKEPAAAAVKPPPKKRIAIGEGEIAAYMQQNGTADMLAERQKRIKEYERQRQKEGRQY